MSQRALGWPCVLAVVLLLAASSSRAWASDSGDAPEVYLEARHGFDPDVRLGELIDDDSASRHSDDAQGDDTFGADDEDGVFGLNFTQGQTTYVRASVYGKEARLQAWIDWNGDGIFTSPDEQVAFNLEDNGPEDLDPASGLIRFAVRPPDYASTKPTFARFRWSVQKGLEPAGFAENGEVEDYQVQVNGKSELLPAEGEASCRGQNLLENGSFELPFVDAGPSYHLLDRIPGWLNRAQPFFKLWLSGYLKVPAHSGRQFMELDVDDRGMITAEAMLQANAEFTVFWAHRGRQGDDTASMEVTLDNGVSFGPDTFKTGNEQWAVYSMTGVTDDVQRHALLLFRSEAAFGDERSVGNLLDSVELCQTFLQLDVAYHSRTDADGNGFDSAGDTITFEYRISNPPASHKSLSNVHLMDSRLGRINVSAPFTGDTDEDAALDPGETWIVFADTPVTQADIAAQSISVRASAVGATDLNALSSAPVDSTAGLTQVPRLEITKTYRFISDNGTAGVADKDDVIRYSYRVRNTGNIPISNVMVNDTNNHRGSFPANPGNVQLTDKLPFADSHGTPGSRHWDVLAPGDELIFTEDYAVVQADVDDGGSAACSLTCL